MIRVLVVDDHPLFRYGLRAALQPAPDIEVVAEAANGRSAIALAGSLRPDVVVMDLSMPGLGGVEATRRIVADNPRIGVLVLSMSDDDESVFAAMRAGARGYLLKGADADDIARAVRVVGESEAIFGPSVAARLRSFLTAAVPPRPEAFPELTEREREVLWLIARGETNGMIARRLVLSAKTIRNNVSNIYRKLNVAGRAQAVARVREANLRDSGRDGSRTARA